MGSNPSWSEAQAQLNKRFAQAIGDPSWTMSQNADAPVEQVSWFDAIGYCNTLSRNEGLEEAYVIVRKSSVVWKGLDAPGYRLPTEAEWEYACRAGSTCDRYGDVDDVAWWDGNSGGNSHPVGQKLPNPWGFFDMLGNVFEWCWDWWGPYSQGAVVDPVGPADGSVRVNRGGGYLSSAEYRAGTRGMGPPGETSMFVGFRPVRSYPSGSLVP